MSKTKGQHIFEAATGAVLALNLAACSQVAFTALPRSEKTIALEACSTPASSTSSLHFTAPKSDITVGGTTLVAGVCSGSGAVEISGAGLAQPLSLPCRDGKFSQSVSLSDGEGFKNLILSQAGASDKDYRCFDKDTTPPNVKFDNPNLEIVPGSNRVVTGICENGLPVVITQPAKAAPITLDCVNGKFSGTIPLNSGDGKRDVVASQTDPVGNTGSDTKHYEVDTTAPIVHFTSPHENTSVQDQVVVRGVCEVGLPVSLGGAGTTSPGQTVCTAGTFQASLTLTPVDGRLNLTVEQVDLAGNRGTDSLNVVRDTHAPVIRITGPAVNTISRTGVTLVGTCESGLTVTVSGAGVGGSTTDCPSGTFSVPVTFTAGDGVKNVVVTQTTATGNSGSDNRNFIRDTTQPVVTIATPVAGALTSSAVTVSGSCETGASDVQISGDVSGVVNAPCTNGSYSSPVTLSNGDGAKTIVATQTDVAGNVGSANRSIVKDTTAPVIHITGPSASGATSSTTITVVGVCESGLPVTIGGTGAASQTTVNCTGGNFSAPVVFSGNDGVKNITASQTDAAGNTGTDNRSFTLDTKPPVITITTPANGDLVKQTAVTVTGTCETGLSVELTGDLASAPATVCSAAGQYSAAVTLTSAEGNKTIIAAQTDLAGNKGTAQVAFVYQAGDTVVESFTTDNVNNKVDILIIDDNSASMDPEQQSMGTRFPAFGAALTGVDWQLGITTTDCSTGPYGICGSFLPMAGTADYILTPHVPNFEQVFLNTVVRPETTNCMQTGTCPSGNEEGLKASMAAMDKRAGANARFFRDDAALAILILTDEDEQSTAPPTATTPQAVIDHVRSIWPNKLLRGYAITVLEGDTQCLQQQQAQPGGNGAYGTYPAALASLTGGMSASICSPDFTVPLRQIGSDLSNLTNSITLAHTPINGNVSVKLTPAQNVTWTVSGQKVSFSSALQPGTMIEVTYRYK